MIRVNELKNYISNDALKDWLQLYEPKDPIPSYFDPEDENVINVHSYFSTFLHQQTQNGKLLLKTPSAIEDLPTLLQSSQNCLHQLELQGSFNNFEYSTMVDCVMTSSVARELFTFVNPPGLDKLVFIILSNDYQANKDYICVKKTVIKQLLLAKFEDTIKFEIYHLDKKGKINEIWYHSKDYKRMLQQASEWVHLVKKEGSDWNIQSDYPPRICMMPNLGLKLSDQYTSRREQLAWKWKEISLLYFIGSVTRQKLHKSNVFTLEHPNLWKELELIYNFEKNQSKRELLQIQKLMVSNMFNEIVTEIPMFDDTILTNNYVYLDVETTMDVRKDNVTVCNLVGLLMKNSATGGKWEYHEFHSTQNDDCIKQVETFLQPYFCSHTIVHYTSADCIAIPAGMKTLDLYSIVTSQFLTSPPLQALHLHNFKLKVIYKNVCKRLGRDNKYDGLEIQNGLQALHALTEWKKTEDNTLLQSVIEYNKVDCVALLLLHQYLENKFDFDAIGWM